MTSVAVLLAEFPWLEDPLFAWELAYVGRLRSVPRELTLGTLATSEGKNVEEIVARINELLAQRSPEAEPAASDPQTKNYRTKLCRTALRSRPTEFCPLALSERPPAEGALATHLSGGMDSSSATCLAREELAGRGGSPLFTLSLVCQRPSLVGERSYINRVLAQDGLVQPCFLEADDVLYYDWFHEALPRHGEPSGLLRSMPSHRLLVRAADQVGAVMTPGGDGSDEIASYQPYHLADLIRRGQWLVAVKEAARWSRSRNRGLGSVLRQFGLEPLCPLWWREGWGPWLRQGYGRWPRLSFFSVPPWVRPGFARRHEMRQRGRTYARRIFGPPTEASWNLSMLATTSGDWQRWYLAAPLGLNLSQPFRDPRLVCFTLGLPGELRGVPGVTKPLLQAAMRGVLPDEILVKECSPGFDDVVGTGLRRNMPWLEQLVRHPLFAELGIIDPEKVIPLLHQAAVGIGDSQATDRLDKTLALIAWFDQVA